MNIQIGTFIKTCFVINSRKKKTIQRVLERRIFWIHTRIHNVVAQLLLSYAAHSQVLLVKIVNNSERMKCMESNAGIQLLFNAPGD